MDLLPHGATLAAYLVACVALSLTPGPDMALYLQRTLVGGRAHGWAALAGGMMGALIHTSAVALGLSALIAASATLYNGLKWIGALYLAYLAYGALSHGSALRLEGEAPAPAKLSQSLATGALINLTNPKVILFYVTFLPQFMDADAPAAPLRLLALGLGFIAIAGPINALIIALAARFLAALRRRPRALRLLDYLVATVMGGFAVRLLWAEAR